jgi:CBS domain-containing protein
VNVADILARKAAGTITIKPTDTIADLSLLLRERRIGGAVVTSDGQTIEGVITERDIAYGLAAHKEKLHAMPVSALMTRTVITCTPRDSAGHVASTMMSRSIRHLPVVEGDRFVGMVSIRDVLNYRVDELQRTTAQLRTFVAQAEQPPQDR